ncbi:MAG: sodium:proton antiporter NhaD [Rikenellaceae bacterium]
MNALLIIIFLVGIVCIAMEDKLHVNKAATALMMAVLSWVVLSAMGSVDDISVPFVEQLGETSETLFFVLGALTIVELTDSHGGFRVVTQYIRTTDKRKLMWVLSFMAFVLSALLDNIATAVIIIAILRKMVADRSDRLIFACMTILAANAGGSFSPIGDVTTILLYTGGQVEPMHQIASLILPSLACMLVPLLIATRFFKKGEMLGGVNELKTENDQMPEVSKKSRLIILFLALLTMISVPIFNEWTHLPPFMRIMAGVAMLWIYTDVMYGRRGEHSNQVKLPLAQILNRLDLSTILFFLGVLMTVGALNTSGILVGIGEGLSSAIPNALGVSATIGVMSSFVDNVALVAATQGMYPLAEAGTYAVNSEFWTFLAYCSVTGGSLLIIGSATGVTVMGMEKVSFAYYLKKFTPLALAGYIVGGALFILLN